MGPMRKQIALRAAVREDARALAELTALAGDGIPEWLWRQDAPQGMSPFEYGAQRAAREGVNFSYQNAVMAMAGDRVAGMVLSYRLPAEPMPLNLAGVPEILHALLRLEIEAAGTYYINAIATYPAFRRLGVASALLHRTYADTLRLGASKVSLTVFEGNQKAMILYRSQGFEIAARVPVIPHEAYPYRGDQVLMMRGVGP